MGFIKGTPDPEGSPNEKFHYPPLPRETEHRILSDLRLEGVDHQLAQQLARAMAKQEQRVVFQQEDIKNTLEYWANRHTHDMSGGEVPDPGEIGPGTACKTTGPSLWLRFTGSGDDPTKMIENTCNPSLSGATPESVEGPYGDASFIPSGMESGTLVQGYNSGGGGDIYRTVACWIALQGDGTDESASGGYIFGPQPGPGGTSREAHNLIVYRSASTNPLLVQARLNRTNIPIAELDNGVWHFVVMRYADDGLFDAWVDGVNVYSDTHGDGSYDGTTHDGVSVLRWENSVGSTFHLTGIAFAEALAWETALSDTEIDQLHTAMGF